MKTIKLITLTCSIFVGILSGCKDEEAKSITVVEGYVRNYYNNKPIDSALVVLQDGVASGGGWVDIGGGNTSSGNKMVTYTDSTGYFRVSISGKYSPAISTGKRGYNFDPDWTDGVAVGVGQIGQGYHKDKILLLKPDTSLCPIIINKGEFIDSLIISFLDFRLPGWVGYGEINPHVYLLGDNVEYEKLVFYGNGPWDICNSCFMYFNSSIHDYLRYNIEIKRNDIWSFKTDSIEIKGYNAIIEIN